MERSPNAIEALDTLKFQIKHLFSPSGVWNLSDQISQISQYYAYLADALNYQRVNIDADPELIQRFESVFLWLQQRLVVYPDSIRRQISNIVENNSLCDLFAILSVLSPKEINNFRQRSFVFSALYSLGFWGFWRPPRYDGLKQLTRSKVLGAKMALKRLSQVLEFAASIEVVDYDDTFGDFKDNFDPNIIDKAKLLTLVNYLHVQANSISDEAVRARLTTRLADLEAEIRKPKIRWGVIITGFFILYGFLADLKTMHPTIYDRPLRTVDSILSVLHKDGLVSSKEQHLLSEGDSQENEDDDTGTIPNPRAAALPNRGVRLREDEDTVGI